MTFEYKQWSNTSRQTIWQYSWVILYVKQKHFTERCEGLAQRKLTAFRNSAMEWQIDCYISLTSWIKLFVFLISTRVLDVRVFVFGTRKRLQCSRCITLIGKKRKVDTEPQMDRSALTGKTFIPSVQIQPLMSDQWKWEKEPEKSSMGTQASRKSTGAPASSLTRATSPSAGHHRNNSFRTDSGVQVGSSSPQGAWLIPPAIPPPHPPSTGWASYLLRWHRPTAAKARHCCQLLCEPEPPSKLPHFEPLPDLTDLTGSGQAVELPRRKFEVYEKKKKGGGGGSYQK